MQSQIRLLLEEQSDQSSVFAIQVNVLKAYCMVKPFFLILELSHQIFRVAVNLIISNIKSVQKFRKNMRVCVLFRFGMLFPPCPPNWSHLGLYLVISAQTRLYVPRCEKTCLLGFQPGLTQRGVYNYRGSLEARNGGFRK